jgi:pimeloyl-ACP methyl ester carboxylesterase
VSDRLFTDGWSQGALNAQWLTQQLQILNVPVSGAAFYAPPTDPFALFSDQATADRTSITTPPGWAFPIVGLVLQAHEYYFDLPGLVDTAIRPEFQNLVKSVLADPDLVNWARTTNETIYFNKDFRTDSGEIVRSMDAPIGKEILIDGITEKYTFPIVSEFLKHLDAAKPYNWTYDVPVRMYYGTQDEIITLGTTEQRLAFLQPSVRPIKVTDADHRGTFLYGMFGTGMLGDAPISSAEWFSIIDQTPVSKAYLTLQNGHLSVSTGSYSLLGVKLGAVWTASPSTQTVEVRSVAADGTYTVIGSLGQSAAAGETTPVYGTARLALQAGEYLGFALVNDNGVRTTLDTKITQLDQNYVVNLFLTNGTPIGLSLTATETSDLYRVADKVASVQTSAMSSFINLSRGDALTFNISSSGTQGTIGLVKLDQSEESGLPIAAVDGLTPDQSSFADAVKTQLISIANDRAGSAYWVAPEDGVFAVVQRMSDGTVLSFGEQLAVDGKSHVLVLGDNVFGFETGLAANNDFDFNDTIVRIEPVVNMSQFVAALYRVDFGRAPDEAGYAAWVSGAIEEQWTPQAIIEKFAASSEYIADFPITMSHDAFIAKLYLNAFNRAPDAEGRAGWVSALDHGMDRSEVILSFSTSDEMIALIGSLPATAPG